MLLMLLLGISLLGVIVYQTNLGEVWHRLQLLGPGGLAGVLALYAGGTLAMSASWLFTLAPVPKRPGWLLRLWRVWLVGNALEYTTPFGSLGGEPAKVILMKRHYGLRVRDVTSSLVLTRMTDLVAQLLFIGTGFALMLNAKLLPVGYRVAAVSGLALLALGAALFFVAQRKRMLGRVRGWLERGWLRKRRLSERFATALDAFHDIDDQLAGFYVRQKARFWLSASCALLEWMAGATAAWVAVNALGYPISFLDALMIEAFLALVRTMLFFVPGDLGTQEGSLVLICGAITGSPAIGLALATIRRVRDLLLVASGLAIGSHYHLRDAHESEAREEAPEPKPARSEPKASEVF
jgi:uncharacterized protein (TIRG00374 family)